jgi:hypothetical protein
MVADFCVAMDTLRFGYITYITQQKICVVDIDKMSRELYGSGDTADKVQNLMNSLGNMGSFLYNTTPVGRVVDTFNKGMEKARADRLAGKPIPSLRKFGMGLKGGCWECRGGGPIPDRNILQQLATQSYQAVPANRVGQLELIRATPTLKFYKDSGNTIVVAIRGTKPTDVDDVSADPSPQSIMYCAFTAPLATNSMVTFEPTPPIFK